ncbi:C-X-C motif chemokine 13 [Pteronotus mesoamericanus]|uniref:C-X-C motif chemokine 13 n=1 Tax=Pteronotus mesoamericanus TaxID=1884717 RepID=UPI0023ECC198|nr:C-X-C motif chemokine 13 [Pteronotus parnellii mesoamericanus]
MKFISGCLLLMLLVSSLSPPAHGVLEAVYSKYRCLCHRFSKSIPRLSAVSKIKISGPGNGCPNIEILVWVKNMAIICLDHKLPQTQMFLKKIRE